MMDTDLVEARRRVETIGAHLQSSISVAEWGVRAPYAPFLLLSTREALAWRTEELARCACDMLERDDVAAGILLTRAVVECATFVWRLKELLEERHKYTPEELQDTFEKMLVGWKNDPESPQSVNILTIIDHMNKQFPWARQWYDELSESAHPNWSGGFGLFGVINRDTYTTTFGRGLRKTPSAVKEKAVLALCGFVELFEHAYDSISDGLPSYLSELEPL